MLAPFLPLLSLILALLSCARLLGAGREAGNQPASDLSRHEGHHINEAAAISYSYAAHYLATLSHSYTAMGFARHGPFRGQRDTKVEEGQGVGGGGEADEGQARV